MAQKKENFWSRYSKLCLRNKVYPSRSVIKNFRSSELSCIVETIRCEHWKYVLPALCNDNSLGAVHFASCVSPHEVDYTKIVSSILDKSKKNKRNKSFPTPYGRSEKNINTITLSLAGLLHSSQTLTMLKLENLSIKMLDAEQLSLGLSKSCYLKSFSLAGCRFEEGAVPVICRGLNRSCVSWVDFSYCDLCQPDFEALSNVIKAHNTRRSNQVFPNTLRYQIPRFQELPGLNRISLNFNCIEDSSLNILIMSIMNDYWIKAIDLQNCGIDDEGADALIVLASNNPAITLIDVRLNEIDQHFLEKLDEQLTLNRSGKDIKFTELPLWKPSELVRKYNAIGKVKVVRRTSVHKLKTAKKIPRSLNVSVKLLQNVQDKCPIMKDASVQTLNERTPLKPKEYEILQNSVKIKLANEIQLRRFYVSKYNEAKEENDRLRKMLKSQNDDIYIDQETFIDIKHTFEKLKIFFDVMKKYGLWEYISMLGFDEATDVIIEENDSAKSVKVTRKDTFFEHENTMEPDGEVCCNCRKADSMCKNTETSCDSSEGAPYCNSASHAKLLHNRNKPTKEDPANDRVAFRLLQEVMNDYNNVSSHQVLNTKSTAGRMPDVEVPDDSTKPSSSKQSGSTSPKAASGAHMLIKKFSYSNMPKQLKELVSPTDFYNIVKKELERCESEARKPSSSQIENSTPQTVGTIHVKQSVYKVANHKNEVNSISTPKESRESSLKLSRKAAIDEEFQNMTIAELIARERAARQTLSKKDSSAKSSISLMSNSKIHKNTNHAKIKDTKSMVKSDQLFTKTKLGLSNCSSLSSSKKIPSRSNVSSDEINSSDSVVTASDKLSHSSVSSSSSNKSHCGKSSSDYSEPKKSYIESVSDASTYKDVESISDIEIASQVYSGVSEKEESASKDNKNTPSAKAFKNGSASSQSTLKDVTEPKSSKPNESVASGSSSASKKSDKPSQGKTKNANKHNKNRPKSNSSKSSSVPSLSDITTVSSRNLNTDSVMKQISASEEKSRGEK